MMKLIQKINENPIVRNLVLALCLFIVFIFTVSLLLTVFTRHNDYIKVPIFEGLSIEEAAKIAESEFLVLEVNDSVHVKGVAGGVILDQNPKPDREVKAGRRIFLVVNSYSKAMVELPYVAGHSLRQAKNNLQKVGLGIDKLVYKRDIATNNILEQQYDGRVIEKDSHLMVEVGSGVTLVVGRSDANSICIVPNIVGLTLYEAKSRLWEVGLNIGSTKFDSDVDNEFINSAKVYRQNPIATIDKALGSVVSFELTLDEDKVKKAERR